MIIRWIFFLMSGCLPPLALAGSTSWLRLEDVLQSVELHYPQIRVAQLEISKAQGNLVASLGKFDPALHTNGQSRPVGGYINQYANGDIEIPTLYNGLKLFAGYRNGQGNWPVYYQNYLTNSGGEYRAGLSMPLLRDRNIDKDRARLLTSSEAVGMKRFEAESLKIRIYHETITAYWSWVQAGQQLKTLDVLLKLAKTRQKAIEKQAVQGDLPKLAITENLQQIMQREQLLNQGKMSFEQASIKLSLYLRDREGYPSVPGLQILPPNLPSDRDQASSRSSDPVNHPALKRLAKYENILTIKRDEARNQLLPYLNAEVFTYKQYGNGGYPLLIPQAAMIGLDFKFPLLQREAKGNLIRAQTALQQVQIENQFLYQQLENELARLRVGIHRLQQQDVFLKKECDYAQKVQQGEHEKFYAGDSTLFLVNQREQTTAQVKLNWIANRIQLEALKDLVRYFSSTRLTHIVAMK